MKRFCILLVMFCLVGATVWADGGGDRPISPEEKAFMQSCYTSTVALLPVPPQGVEKKPQELTIPRTLGLGTERYPVPFSYYCDYIKTADMGKIMNIAADGKGLEEMSEQMSKISEEMEKAISSGDNNKVMELQAKMQAVMSGNSTMQKMQGTIADQKNQSLHFNVAINPNGADYYQYKLLPARANTTYLIRRDKNASPTNSYSSTDTVLFIGNFGKKAVNDTLEIYAPRVEARSTKIHRLIISIQGEAALADEYIAKMNLAGLEELTR